MFNYPNTAVASSGEVNRIESIVERAVAGVFANFDALWPVIDRPLSADEASRYLGVHKVSLLKAVRQGRGPKHIGQRKWMRFRKPDLDSWLVARAGKRVSGSVR
jgi:excisionase family DNA binding protein